MVDNAHTHISIFIFITFSLSARLRCVLSVALLHVLLFCWLVCVPLQSGIFWYCAMKRNAQIQTTDYASGLFFSSFVEMSHWMWSYCMLERVYGNEWVSEWVWYVNLFSDHISGTCTQGLLCIFWLALFASTLHIAGRLMAKERPSKYGWNGIHVSIIRFSFSAHSTFFIFRTR